MTPKQKAIVKLGKKKSEEFAYRITDHKDRELKVGGHEKGIQSLRDKK